jgi:hypothetical protein
LWSRSPVVDGSIASHGTQYVVGLRARNCTTGDILADEQTQAARKEDVLGALSQIASRFRTRVGESLPTIEKYSTPLQEATTSLEALKAYSTAAKVRASSGAAAARALFERAVEIDPNFAIAHARLGLFYSTLGESASSRQSTLKAHKLRDRASDAERFFIDTLYDRDSHRQSGTGAADAGDVGADLSPQCASSRIALRFRHEEHGQIHAVARRSQQGNRSRS